MNTRADLAETLVPTALRLAWLVREQATTAIHRILTNLPDHHRDALIIVLAAAVDIDQTPAQLLGWTAHEPTEPPDLRTAAYTWPDTTLRHLHAAWNRGEHNDITHVGEQEYCRRRSAARRARKDTA